MTCGIYGITNNKSEAMYVGRAKDIEKRFFYHCNAQPIDVAIANEGINNFTLSVIEELPNDLNLLKQKERYWINYYDVENNPKHYNVSQSGHNHCGAKYFLWDSTQCSYHKNNMYQHNRNPDPCRCFTYRYNNTNMPMGLFEDFVSCEVIDQLVKDALEGVYNGNNNR